MSNKQIWIGFCDDTDLRWLCFLKKGFRHCFAFFQTGEGQWVSYDPLSSGTEIQILPVKKDFDLPAWIAEREVTLVCAAIKPLPKKCAPFAPFTCVEAIKRLLGIHRRGIITPWQLYQYLNKGGENNGKHSTKTKSTTTKTETSLCAATTCAGTVARAKRISSGARGKQRD